ncbi:MAG: DNA primase [Fimbriimonadaceae bacterium]
MADERDEIRSRVDIVELVGQKVVLKKTGKNWKGLCPFHADKRPSFDVSQLTQRFTCWSCGEKGDIFDWVMKTENVEFAEAIQILAKRAGIELRNRKPEDKSAKLSQQAAMEEALGFFKNALSKSTDARAYCDGRGLDEEVRSTWEIGYAPDVGDALASQLQRRGFSLQVCKGLFLVDQDTSGGFYDKFRGRLMFPIRDERGELVAFGGRLLGDGHPKYINSSDTPLYRKSKVLYGLNKARDPLSKARRAVLVEGYLDVIACHRAGVQTAIASLGTAMSDDQARLLRRWCDEVAILYDSDAAGQKAAARAAEMLVAESLRVRVALMPDGEDPDTLLRNAGPEAVQQAVERGISPLDYKLQAIENRLTPDKDEFWTETVAALAGALTPIELDSHLERLAAKYPGTKDRLHAQKMLRNWVIQIRRNTQRRPVEATPTAIVPIKPPRAQLQSGEAILLKALLSEDLCPEAWTALQEPDILITPAAIELITAMKSQFGESGPKGPPGQWLAHVQSESMLDLLLDVESREDPLTQKFVSEAADWLRRKREERQTQSLKQNEMDNDYLQFIQDRLRSLNPDDRDPKTK